MVGASSTLPTAAPETKTITPNSDEDGAILMDLGLRGKAVLVTGGASGIGAETAAQFAGEGAKVVVADINADATESMAQRLREAGAAAIGVAADVTVAASVAQLVELALKSFGRLDVVVNNA